MLVRTYPLPLRDVLGRSFDRACVGHKPTSFCCTAPPTTFCLAHPYAGVLALYSLYCRPGPTHFDARVVECLPHFWFVGFVSTLRLSIRSPFVKDSPSPPF